MMVYSHSGQVKVKKRKWNFTSWVFCTMKMSRTPMPVSEAIAPPPSLPLLCSGALDPLITMTCPLSVRSRTNRRVYSALPGIISYALAESLASARRGVAWGDAELLDRIAAHPMFANRAVAIAREVAVGAPRRRCLMGDARVVLAASVQTTATRAWRDSQGGQR